MTNIVELAVLVTTLITTNVIPLKPDEGFPERIFKTNVVQTTTYEFSVNTNFIKVIQIQTNSSTTGVYLPVVKTNLISAHYQYGWGVVPNK